MKVLVLLQRVETSLRIYTNYRREISGTSKRTTGAQEESMTYIVNMVLGPTAISLHVFHVAVATKSIHFIHRLFLSGL